MKKIILILSLAVISKYAFAQAPSIEWQRSYGSSGTEEANSIQQTSDGGYIVAGYSDGFNGDVTGNHGGSDCWVVKLTPAGNIQWQRSLGGSNDDRAFSVQQTADGGYIVAARSNSNNGDVTGNHGLSDVWIVKLSSSGGLDWQKSLGGTASDEARSIQQTSDGGYIVAGNSASNNGDVTGGHGGADYWVVKLTNAGEIEWQKTFGGSVYETVTSALQTTDGGYIVAGYSSSNNGDVIGNNGAADFWIIKLSTLGAVQWKKAYGSSGFDIAWCIRQTFDDGYIVVGQAAANDGDVSGSHGNDECWVLKLSSSGNIQWQKSLGGTGYDYARSVLQTSDSGYIVGAFSTSDDCDVTGNHGNYDFWIVKLSALGNIIWQKSMGGADHDFCASVQPTADGGYIVAGYSLSNDGDVSGNHGGEDFWIVKLKSQLSVDALNNTTSASLFPNPTTGIVFVKGQGRVDIKAYNMLGRLIKEAANTDNISLAEFPAGMYFIKLINENGQMVSVNRIIKQ